MRKIALAMTAVLGLSFAVPAFAGEPDSGSVGQFTQWQRAPLPSQRTVGNPQQAARQPAPQSAQVAHR